MGKQYEIALVEWQDSCSKAGWHDPNEDDGVANCTTVGVIVRKNRTVLTVVQCMASNREQNHAFSIPRGAVKSITILGSTTWPSSGSKH